VFLKLLHTSILVIYKYFEFLYIKVLYDKIIVNILCCFFSIHKNAKLVCINLVIIK